MNPNPEIRIGAIEVRRICGGVSDMCLWRWLNNSKMEFPPPVVVNRRRYWKEADVIAWWDRQIRWNETAA